jgi:chemotaxis protein MotB
MRRPSSVAGESPWTALSDIMMTMVMLIMLLVIAIFLQTFRERDIAQRIVARQREVARSIRSGLAEPSSVRIDSVSPDRQRLTFSAELLFPSCSARLKEEGARVLRVVGASLRAKQPYFERIEVEGHTDIQRTRSPGRGCEYPSNWELSSARATAVVVLLAGDSLVRPQLLSATGRAEFHPVDSASLDPNRRIEMILQYERGGVLRPGGPDAQR